MDKSKAGLEDAAKVYASFVESFQGPPGSSSLHPAARLAQANQRLTGLAALPPHLEAAMRNSSNGNGSGGGGLGWVGGGIQSSPPLAGFRSNGNSNILPPRLAAAAPGIFPREFTPASRPGPAPGLGFSPSLSLASSSPASFPPASSSAPPSLSSSFSSSSSSPSPSGEPPKKSVRGAKKRSNIDAFLEEMKRRDEMREKHIDPDAVILPPSLSSSSPLVLPSAAASIVSSPYLTSTPPLSLLQTPLQQQQPPMVLPYLRFPIPPSSLSAPLSIAGAGGGGGSHDMGDPTTTNLYVGNLPPEVTEQILAKEFGLYGDIASVKIMWPRTEEEHARRKNCGFVSYMERKDAEEAVEKLRELVLFGSPIRVGWGKPVALPQIPLFVCSDPNRQRSTPLPPHIQAASEAGGGFVTTANNSSSSGSGSDSNSGSSDNTSSGSEELVIEIPTGHPRFEISLPKDSYLLFLINRMSLYVSKMGQNFEKLVMEREIRDPRFAFLFMIQSPEHMYYRWKTYSLSQKDTMDKWRTLPFQMITGGPFWIPPPLTPLTKISRSRSISGSRSRSHSRSRSSSRSSSSSSRSRSRSRERERKNEMKERDKTKKRKGWDVVKPAEGQGGGGDLLTKQPLKLPLSSLTASSISSSNIITPTIIGAPLSHPRSLRPGDVEKFEDMLRDLTTNRQSIAEGMAFALDHAEHAKEIVAIITDAMCILDTPVPKKIARLFLISDILHNSGLHTVKNASAYRSAFQTSLKTVFVGLSEKYASLEGRMTAQAFKDKVESVLNAWHAWSVFPSSLMATLEAWKDVKRRKSNHPSDTDESGHSNNSNGSSSSSSTTTAVVAVQPNDQTAIEQLAKKAKADKVEILGGVPLGGTYEDDSDDERPKEDEEDVDGVPLGETTTAALNDEEEDVDGVPLNEPSAMKAAEKKKKKSGLAGTVYADSDSESDIDGAPL